ncbi:MAG: hypothetical protein QG608_3765, partial [Actinomycetota bacterium]|nr:hypothetical protein [Actinomycetota bacterium]
MPPMSWATEVDDRYLRRFVVHVQGPERGQFLGSGVLVAPGWVLTCTHVVGELVEVTIVPDRSASDGSGPVPDSVPGRVKARSGVRDPRSGTVFWPFPDLALVELRGWTGHVYVPIEAVQPSRAEQAHAWGFGCREDGQPAVGSPASFTFVGGEGDGFFSLEHGDATPGLSGAPLVCTVARAVVALMSVSRDPSHARGGWAAPVSALEGGDGIPEDLSGLGRNVLSINRQGAWRHRETWHRALPIQGSRDLPDRPWDVDTLDPQTDQPSLMLRPEFRHVPFQFRDNELADFLRWCAGPQRLAISHLAAAGGAGKTRFAVEACLTLERRGWVTGFLPRTDRGGDGIALPRLFVVDYVDESDADTLVERIGALARSATTMAPVRLLFLSRPILGTTVVRELDTLRGLATGAALQALHRVGDRSSAAAGLTTAERADLFEQARDRFADSPWGAALTGPASSSLPDLTAEQYARPLDVLFEAFDAALTGAMAPSGGRAPIDRVLDHEVKHWRTRMRTLPEALLVRCVAVATLAGARDDTETLSLLALLTDVDQALRQTIDSWLRGLYPGPWIWNPLRPDRLGEALVIRAVTTDPDAGSVLLGRILDLSSDAQVEHALDVLSRAASHPVLSRMTATTVIDRHHHLVQRARRQTRGTPERPGHTGLLEALLRLHIAVLNDERISSLPLPAQAALSASSDVLADLAVAHGRSTQAEIIFTSALRIDERKTDLEPGNTTYRRDLSISYNKLADLALAAGRSGDAEALYRQSL